MISVSLEQPENELFPIDVTLPGIAIDDKELQSQNALSPMIFTPSESVIDDNLEHSKNALFPIVVTPSGIVKFPCFPLGYVSNISPSFEYRVPFIELYALLFESILISVSDEQSANAPSPIAVILSGIVIDDNSEQP